MRKKLQDQILNTMTKILIFIGIFLILFVITMIVTFWVKDSVPDSLIEGVFGACGAECGIMGLLRIAKWGLKKRAGIDLDEVKEEKEEE